MGNGPTEVEWLQEEHGDLTDPIVAIQDQLPEDYADRKDGNIDYTVRLSAEHMALVKPIIDELGETE
jgi:hypothetical protein